MNKMILKPLSDSFHKHSFAPNSDELSYTWKNEVRVHLDCALWFQRFPNMEMATGTTSRYMKPEICFNVTGLIPERKYDMFLSLSIVAGTRFKYQNREFVPSNESADDYTRTEIPIETAKSGAEWMAGVTVCSGFKIAQREHVSGDKCFEVKLFNKYMPAITIREHENPQTAAYFLLAAPMFYTVSKFKNPSMGYWKKTYLWSDEKKDDTVRIQTRPLDDDETRMRRRTLDDDQERIRKRTLDDDEKRMRRRTLDSDQELMRKRALEGALEEEVQKTYKNFLDYVANLMAPLSIVTSQDSQSTSIAPQNVFVSPPTVSSLVAQALLFLSNSTNPFSSFPLPNPTIQQSSYNVPSSSGSFL